MHEFGRAKKTRAFYFLPSPWQNASEKGIQHSEVKIVATRFFLLPLSRFCFFFFSCAGGIFQFSFQIRRKERQCLGKASIFIWRISALSSRETKNNKGGERKWGREEGDNSAHKISSLRFRRSEGNSFLFELLHHRPLTTLSCRLLAEVEGKKSFSFSSSIARINLRYSSLSLESGSKGRSFTWEQTQKMFLS